MTVRPGIRAVSAPRSVLMGRGGRGPGVGASVPPVLAALVSGVLFAVVASRSARRVIKLVLSVVVASSIWVPRAEAAPWHNRSACVSEGLGWHFYCDPEPEAKAEHPEDPPGPPRPPIPEPDTNDPDDPRARIAAIQAELDRLKALAILEPTEHNVRNYIAFQSRQLARAATFSDRWRRTVWQNPELDYSLRRPTGSVAKRAWLETRTAERTQALERLSERYGVFYFFQGQDCLPCVTGAGVVRGFVDSHGIDLMAVSLDGHGIEAFPNAITDQGQAARLGIDRRFLPALALYDSQTRTVIPVGHGVMAADELAARIHTLTAVGVGEDY